MLDFPCPSKSLPRWTRSSASTSAATSLSRSFWKRKSAATTFSITRRRTSRCNGDKLLARGHTLKVQDKEGDHYALTIRASKIWPSAMCVLLRQDPPFDMAYITTTHLLERIHPKTLVVNDPAHVRNAPEKIWVLDFLDLMPPTLVTRQLDDVHRLPRRSTKTSS